MLKSFRKTVTRSSVTLALTTSCPPECARSSMPQYVISIRRSPDGEIGQPRRQENGRSLAVTRLILDSKRCGAVVAGAGAGAVSPVRVGVGGVAGLVRSESLEPRPHPAAPAISAAA